MSFKVLRETAVEDYVLILKRLTITKIKMTKTIISKN